MSGSFLILDPHPFSHPPNVYIIRPILLPPSLFQALKELNHHQQQK